MSPFVDRDDSGHESEENHAAESAVAAAERRAQAAPRAPRRVERELRTTTDPGHAGPDKRQAGGYSGRCRCAQTAIWSSAGIRADPASVSAYVTEIGGPSSTVRVIRPDGSIPPLAQEIEGARQPGSGVGTGLRLDDRPVTGGHV